MKTQRSTPRRRPGVSSAGHVSRDKILTVGLSDALAASLPQRLFGTLADSTQSIEIDAIDQAALAQAMVVLSPIFGRKFDAIDLAGRLHSLGYAGRYIAATPSLPNRGMVLREVAHVAPDLSFDIVETERGPHPAFS